MEHTIRLPDGYEFDHVASPILGNGGGALTVILKKKQQKTFDWYVDQYLDVSAGSTNDELRNWLDNDDLKTMSERLKTKQYNLVPWEVKIGLCCFICNEIGIPWSEYIHQFNGTVYCDEIKQVNDIVPDGFRDDIINKTK